MNLCSATQNMTGTIALLAFVSTISGAANAQGKNPSSVVVNHRDSTWSIENGLIRIEIDDDASALQQSIFARKGETWQLVARSFRPQRPFPEDGNSHFDTRLSVSRYMVHEILASAEVASASDTAVTLRLFGSHDDVDVVQYLTVEQGQAQVHFDVRASFKSTPPRLDYLMSCFAFALDRIPEFVHTPTLKYDDPRAGPGSDQVIGDRAFHAPAVILQEDEQFAALVPDLDAINQHRVTSPDARRKLNVQRNQFSVPEEHDKYTMPTFLDLNVNTGLTRKPVFTFGLADNVTSHHIRYQRYNDDSMVRTLDHDSVRYEFDLLVSADAPAEAGYQEVSRFHWSEYGKQVFRRGDHQVMPFEQYVRLLQEVTLRPLEVHPPVAGYSDTGSFLFFEVNGQDVGGYRNAAPFMIDNLSNSEFWNNVRDAVGMFYWGRQLNDAQLLDMAKRTINLALLAPQNGEGMFPLNYRAAERKWVRNMFSASANRHSHLFTHVDKEGDTYNLVAMSKTSAHLLEYYRRCEQDERIIEYVRPYADSVIRRIDEQGRMPSYVSAESGEAFPPLSGSAQSAATMWFLAEFYAITDDTRYLDGAESIAGHLIENVLPRQLWTDLEQYYSCGNKPFDFRGDEEQGQPARGNLSVFWACEGFASLYRATHDQKYLDAGERCIDYCAFSQCCWDPHFIYTAFPFGGFTVDNADTATMLDARQAEMVEPFAWYGRALGRQDLLERAVAAARSSVVLINHPLHKMNSIYRHTNIYPFGLGPENIDHEGHPQSAMRTSPSWGEGSGVFTGLAEARRELGGVFVDLEHQTAVGVDGLRVDDVKFTSDVLRLRISNTLSALAVPWEQPYQSELKVIGIPAKQPIVIIVNDGQPLQATGNESTTVALIVRPDGSVHIQN